MPRFGYHIDPPLADIPEILNGLRADTFQTTLRDPRRLSKEGVPDGSDQDAYLAAVAASRSNPWGMVHSSLLTSLGSPDPRIRNASASTLIADANLASKLGLSGVCFHTGYQKGHSSRADAHNAVARKLTEALARLEPGAQVWLENGCEGTELGQTIAELAEVFDRVRDAGGEISRLGLVIDTCHLHVAGFDLAAPEGPDTLAQQIEAAGLSTFLRALHLNDAREPCGSHRDRHAPPGQGTIGKGLIRLCAHPLFAPLPAILEVRAHEAEEGIDYLRQG